MKCVARKVSFRLFSVRSYAPAAGLHGTRRLGTVASPVQYGRRSAMRTPLSHQRPVQRQRNPAGTALNCAGLAEQGRPRPPGADGRCRFPPTATQGWVHWAVLGQPPIAASSAIRIKAGLDPRPCAGPRLFLLYLAGCPTRGHGPEWRRPRCHANQNKAALGHTCGSSWNAA